MEDNKVTISLAEMCLEHQRIGRKQVVDWIKGIAEGNPAVDKSKIYPSEWARKLKEWGL